MTVSATCSIDELPQRCSVTDTYEYDAYGNEFTVSGGSNTPNEMMYRGEQWDSDLGLYYLRARYYNPLTGRFMSRDPEDPKLRDANGKPIDPKKLHKYLYANGDPVNRIDPKGKDAIISYGLQEGDSEATAAELRVVDLAVRDEVITACIELNSAAFVAGGLPDPVAYSYAQELCRALIL